MPVVRERDIRRSPLQREPKPHDEARVQQRRICWATERVRGRDTFERGEQPAKWSHPGHVIGDDRVPPGTVGGDVVVGADQHGPDLRGEAGAKAGFDPVWRMPFHDAYDPVIEPGIADLDNAPGFGFAGSITAALFLRRFADHPRYLHFDIYGHAPSDAPARPKGGAGQGARAILGALPAILGL